MAFGFVVFETDMGWIGIVGTEKGIIKTTLPLTDKVSISESFEKIYGNEANSIKLSYLSDAATLLKRYFKGQKVDFPFSLDISKYTDFQAKVWKITRTIPYGELRSYKWVAHQAGNPKSARAVGQALASNPIPIIIPCHRVVSTNGDLKGFTGGLELKEKLIKLEKGVFKNNGLTI